MALQISPFGNDQFFLSNGTLAVGVKLFTYLAGSTTKEPVYTDIGGLSPHTNPIILNSIGMPPSPIYLSKAKLYKFVYAPSTDSDPPVAPIYTADNISVGTVITEGGNITGGINEARTTVASASAPDIFALTVGNTVDYTGTATASGFAASPQAGAQRILVCAAAAKFTAGANLIIEGVTSGQTYTATAGEKILAIAMTTTLFHLTPIATKPAVKQALALGFITVY
jgi:hypothetical protein